MISKKDITKIAKRILRKQQGLRDHQIIHPRRDWIIGLVAVVIAVIGAGAWSSLTYLEITNRSIEAGGEEVISQTVYRTEIVDSALSIFRSRAENYQQLLENRVATPVTIPVSTEPEPVEEDVVPTEDPTDSESESDLNSEEPSVDETETPQLSF